MIGQKNNEDNKAKKSQLRPIDAPHFGYWQALYNAFYNPKLYVDVGKRWKRFSIIYLFLLIAVATVPMYFVVMKAYNDSINQNMLEPLEKLPRLYVQNGIVATNEPMPLFIKNKAGAVSVIVDTTGSITQFDKKYPRLSLLITKNAIMFRMPSLNFDLSGNKYQMPEGEVVTHYLPKNLNQIFDTSEWVLSSKMRFTQKFVNILIYPTMVMLIFGTYLVLLFALALMAQFVAKILIKFDLSYFQSFRLLMVAATPQIFVTLILTALGWTFSGFGLVSIVLFAVYFSFAAISMKRESNKMVLG